MKSLLEHKSTGNAIAFWALIVSIVSLIVAYCAGERTSRVEEQLRAYQYQPRLALFRPPHIKAVESRTVFFNPDSILRSRQGSDSTSSPVLLNAKLRITSQLFLKNTGNALAKIVGYVQTDTTSYQPIIRALFRRAIQAGDSVEIIERLNEVPPGDSTVLTLEAEVSFISLNHFTLHYLILYENEMGNLYDSYFWAPFVIREFEMIAEFTEVDAQRLMRLIYPKLKAGDIVSSAGPTNDSFFTYDPNEAGRIRARLESLVQHAGK